MTEVAPSQGDKKDVEMTVSKTNIENMEEGKALEVSPVPSGESTVTVVSNANSSAPLIPGTTSGKAEADATPDIPIPLTVWTVLFISCFGVFMAAVSTSALIIAFPVVLVDLRMNISTMMWVLLVLLLVMGAVVPIAGKLGDIFGQSEVYIAGYWIFVLGSLGGGLVDESYKGYDLVAARTIIGLGAALLFTNSSAILTNAFAPYHKVGLSQGIFGLSSAMGIVIGPLLGGGFSSVAWRWIFFYNVPLGGLCALLATYVLRGTSKPVNRTWTEHRNRFDWIGATCCSLGLVLILMAMIQAVVPDPVLSKTGPIVGLIVGGSISGIIFIVDQFYAVDPLIPPKIFLDYTYSITTFSGAAMAFVRNSITYNMIFYLQGPQGEDPLAAGIALIPFGLGIMFAGLLSGGLSDKVGVRNLATFGPLVTMAAVAGMSSFDQYTSAANIGGVLFVSGLGVGLFQSPNMMCNMLSVLPEYRGVAAAVSMLTMTFSMMAGIVLTFSFVLNSMSQADLFKLFIFGGSSLSNSTVRMCLDALQLDYYILIAFCGATALASSTIPGDFVQQARLRQATYAKISSTESSKSIDGGSEKQTDEQVTQEGEAKI